MIKIVKVRSYETVRTSGGATLISFEPDYNDGSFLITYDEDAEYIGVPMPEEGWV